MKRVIRSGNIVEEFYLWQSDEKQSRAERKKGASDMRKVDANYTGAIKRLRRSINSNFTYGDLFITLSYDDTHLGDRAKCIRDRDLFLRRMKRLLAARGVDIKYIAVLGEKSTKTGEDVRLHHHILLPRVDLELLQAQWTMGGINYRLLQKQDDYVEVAVYMLKNVDKTLTDAKKYKPSRNLDKPEFNEVIARSAAPIQPPKGAKVLSRGEYDPLKCRDYVVYVVPEGKRREVRGVSSRAGDGIAQSPRHLRMPPPFDKGG